MPTSTSLRTLLERSEEMDLGWREVLAKAGAQYVPGAVRERLALDACALVLTHGQAIRLLLSSKLENPALALLRVQHEALLRAAWLAHAAADAEIAALAAPQTDEALKQANQLPPCLACCCARSRPRTRPLRSSKACGSSVISPGPAPTPTPTPVCCPRTCGHRPRRARAGAGAASLQCPWLRGLHDLGQIPRQRDGPPQHQPGRDHPCRLHGVALGA